MQSINFDLAGRETVFAYKQTLDKVSGGGLSRVCETIPEPGPLGEVALLKQFINQIANLGYFSDNQNAERKDCL